MVDYYNNTELHKAVIDYYKKEEASPQDLQSELCNRHVTHVSRSYYGKQFCNENLLEDKRLLMLHANQLSQGAGIILPRSPHALHQYSQFRYDNIVPKSVTQKKEGFERQSEESSSNVENRPTDSFSDIPFLAKHDIDSRNDTSKCSKEESFDGQAAKRIRVKSTVKLETLEKLPTELSTSKSSANQRHSSKLENKKAQPRISISEDELPLHSPQLRETDQYIQYMNQLHAYNFYRNHNSIPQQQSHAIRNNLDAFEDLEKNYRKINITEDYVHSQPGPSGIQTNEVGVQNLNGIANATCHGSNRQLGVFPNYESTSNQCNSIGNCETQTNTISNHNIYDFHARKKDEAGLKGKHKKAKKAKNKNTNAKEIGNKETGINGFERNPVESRPNALEGNSFCENGESFNSAFWNSPLGNYWLESSRLESNGLNNGSHLDNGINGKENDVKNTNHSRSNTQPTWTYSSDEMDTRVNERETPDELSGHESDCISHHSLEAYQKQINMAALHRNMAANPLVGGSGLPAGNGVAPQGNAFGPMVQGIGIQQPLIHSPLVGGLPAANGFDVTSPSSVTQMTQMLGNTPADVLSRALVASKGSRKKRGEKKPIPIDMKDERYFERRKRNNVAAKKSRDARKKREDEIAARASDLERENFQLKQEFATLAAYFNMKIQEVIANGTPAHVLLNNLNNLSRFNINIPELTNILSKTEDEHSDEECSEVREKNT